METTSSILEKLKKFNSDFRLNGIQYCYDYISDSHVIKFEKVSNFYKSSFKNQFYSVINEFKEEFPFEETIILDDSSNFELTNPIKISSFPNTSSIINDYSDADLLKLELDFSKFIITIPRIIESSRIRKPKQSENFKIDFNSKAISKVNTAMNTSLLVESINNDQNHNVDIDEGYQLAA